MTDLELDVADSLERLFPIPTVDEEWDDVLDRARGGRPRASWGILAVAATLLAGTLLVAPALGVGTRLLDLVRGAGEQPVVQTPAWSPDGRTIAVVSRRDGNSEIYLVDVEGGGQRNLTRHPARDFAPAWSPDGRRIAFVSRRDGQSDIYVVDPDGRALRNLSRHPAADEHPVWSPDGRRIAFVSTCCFEAGMYAPKPNFLHVVNADGTGLRRLTNYPAYDFTPVWTPDGRTLRYGRNVVNVDGSPSRRLPRFLPKAGAWSPDGTRVAWVQVCHGGPSCRTSAARERNQLLVMNADGSGVRSLARRIAWTVPLWSPDGRRLAFRRMRDGNPELYSVNARGGGLTRLTRHAARERWFSWSPDGTKLAFVRNWEVYVVNADGSGERRLTRRGG